MEKPIGTLFKFFISNAPKTNGYAACSWTWTSEMSVHQWKLCCRVYLVSGKIVDYAGQRCFSSHGHSHVADWFAKLGHICKITRVKHYLSVGFSAADSRKVANLKGICMRELKFTQMRPIKFVICTKEVLNRNTTGVYKIDSTVLCTQFYSLCRVNKELLSRVKAVPWLRRLVAGLSPRRTGLDPGSVHVGFVVDKVVLR
jgi:hypothetical protein